MEHQGGRSRPLWFGPEDRPLFGWLHSPASGEARGGVVLCPTLGIEAVNARYAYRCLADRLAEAGFVALRFDYDGTGDSGGEQDEPGRVEAWLRSIDAATDLVRGLQLGRFSVVGLRMGATFVAQIFGSGPAAIDDLVLWDPCASGRAFLREQGALWRFALGAESVDDGTVETPGLVFDKDTVGELSALAIANGEGPLADRVLVLVRAGRTGDRRMNERLALPHVERRDISGQEELVDVKPDAATVPEETLSTMVEWLSARAASGPAVAIDPNTVGRTLGSVGTAPDGAMISERVVSLGPIGLFGIMTTRSPPGDGPGDAATGPAPVGETPTIFFFNAGVIDHLGPARLWVQLSRRWAHAGLRSVRFDLSGIGDSPVHAGQPNQEVYSSEALDDVVEVLRAVSPADPSNAVLVGLCSGAYYAVDGAIVGKVRGLCAVNPILTFSLSDADPGGGSEPSAGPLEGRREVSGGMKSWVRTMPAYDRINRIVQRLPSAAWWIINRVAVEMPPARRLGQVVDAGVNVLVIAGTDEGRWLRGGEGRTLRQLERTGRFRMEVIPGLEHTLFERRTRDAAVEILIDHVVLNFAAPSGQA
jgi:alpha-beta hydrolase superfamily lysophospholipase